MYIYLIECSQYPVNTTHNKNEVNLLGIGQLGRKELPLVLKHVSLWINKLYSVVWCWIVRSSDHHPNRGWNINNFVSIEFIDVSSVQRYRVYQSTKKYVGTAEYIYKRWSYPNEREDEVNRHKRPLETTTQRGHLGRQLNSNQSKVEVSLDNNNNNNQETNLLLIQPRCKSLEPPDKMHKNKTS